MCENSFARKDYLTVHERAHTGSVSYKYDVCNKRFAVPRTLKMQRRLTQEKSLINVKFVRRALLGYVL